MRNCKCLQNKQLLNHKIIIVLKFDQTFYRLFLSACKNKQKRPKKNGSEAKPTLSVSC